MRRAPKYVAAAILALTWAASVAGCVSVPVPPGDMGKLKAGQLGTLTARVVVAYTPNYGGLAQAALDRVLNKKVEGYAK